MTSGMKENFQKDEQFQYVPNFQSVLQIVELLHNLNEGFIEFTILIAGESFEVQWSIDWFIRINEVNLCKPSISYYSIVVLVVNKILYLGETS